jgi:hypothetical protein
MMTFGGVDFSSDYYEGINLGDPPSEMGVLNWGLGVGALIRKTGASG